MRAYMKTDAMVSASASGSASASTDIRTGGGDRFKKGSKVYIIIMADVHQEEFTYTCLNEGMKPSVDPGRCKSTSTAFKHVPDQF